MDPRALGSGPRLFVDNFLRSKFDVHFNEFEVISFNENTLAETGICLLSWMKMRTFDAMVILAKVGYQTMSGESRQVSKYLAMWPATCLTGLNRRSSDVGIWNV